MQALPPPGSLRRRVAVALAAVLWALGAYVFVLGMRRWLVEGHSLQLTLVVTAVLWIDLTWLMSREVRKQLKQEL